MASQCRSPQSVGWGAICAPRQPDTHCFAAAFSFGPADSHRNPILHSPPTVRNEPAPPKWSKGWTDLPQASDRIGAYTAEQLERMNQDFTAAVERAFRAGSESEKAATATYDLRRLSKV